MEVGVGIHGEPGRERDEDHSADAIVDELFDAVVNDLPFKSGDRVALMVNGLGGTPISELYVLYRRAHKQLADRGITVARNYVERVLHVARHGRRLAHPGQARRRDRGAARRPRRGSDPRLLGGGADRAPDISLQQAEKIIEACKAEAVSVGQPMNIAVVDDGGNLVAFAAMDDTKLIGENISQRKALTAVLFQMDTKDLGSLVQPGAALYGIESTSDGRLVVFAGGVLLRDAERPGRRRGRRERRHGRRGPPGRGGRPEGLRGLTRSGS